MPKKPNIPADAPALRRRAEARVKARHPKAGAVQTEGETLRLVHELQVHQVELEMQNEELQEARDKTEALLEKYTDLYDFAPVGYVTLDREGSICEANLTCASLLGIPRSRLVRRPFGLFVPPADLPAFSDFLKKVFGSKAQESCEVSLLREGKSPIEVRLEATVAASGRECRAVVRDITERKQAEADRLILSKLESTGILAGGMAHDFNNLLTAILLNLDLAQTLIPSGEELASCVEEAKRSALLAQGLTQQLITFAKGGASVRKATSLAPLILESVRAALSGSRVRGEFSLADDLWPAEVDEGQIGEVIRNMVLNAREAMPEGGVVSVRAENLVRKGNEPSSLSPWEYVRVSIADRGGGIAKEALPKIFDPYFSTKQRGEQKGMGLGLTICHTVIKKHGGAIAVESEEGSGTTFHIYLPASRKLGREEKTPLPKVLPRRGTILVMDDEEGLRKVVGAWLQRLGHKVELAADGEKAIEVFAGAKARGHPFDVVILDLTVRGGMGGDAAIMALRKIDPAVKAIVMSGYGNDPVVQEHERYGFKGALAKPFGVGKLQEILSQVMGN